MKIKRSVLEQIVKEELVAHLRELLEKEDDVAGVVDADDEKKSEKKPDQKDASKASPEKTQAKEPAAKELPVADEPEADSELEKDVAGEDDVEDAEEVTGGKISDEITGKTIQSVTMEPKSKTLPGAQEIVVTFREMPDPLKILVTKTGTVKFFYKGLHNEL